MLAGQTATGLEGWWRARRRRRAGASADRGRQLQTGHPGRFGDESVDPRSRRSDPCAPLPARRRRRRAAAGLLSRRRPGARRPRDARRSVQADLPRGRSARVVGRLPAGTRAQGACGFRRRVRSIPMGARSRRRVGGGLRPSGGRGRQRRRQPRRNGLAACARRGRPAARGAVAVLPGHQLPRRDAVANVVRRRVLPHQARYRVVPRQVPRRRARSTRPTHGYRRCWPTTCPDCRLRWC